MGKKINRAELSPEDLTALRAKEAKNALEYYYRHREKCLAKNKARRDLDPDLAKSRNKAYQSKKRQDPEWVEKQRARGRAYFHNNKAQALRTGRISRLKHLYGLDEVAFNALMHAQDGRCAICRCEPNTWHGRLVVDHCHTTNVVRGLLCDECNVGLGRLGDGNIDRLRAAIDYLERSRVMEQKSA